MMRKVLFFTRPFRYWVEEKTFKYFYKKSDIHRLKNIFYGRPVIVVGNGPSLNKTPLDEFLDIPSIGMNKIDLIFNRVKWRPDLIISVNNLVVKQHCKIWKNINIPVYLSWKCRHFIPRDIRCEFNYFLSRPTNIFSKEISLWVGQSETVTFPALQFAYYMGCNPIIIFGVDHSFSFSGKPNDICKSRGEDKNHFDPNYFQEGQFWGLPNLEGSEVAYKNAYEHFKASGIKIFDATIGGKLNIFPKISVEKAKEICGISN